MTVVCLCRGPAYWSYSKYRRNASTASRTAGSCGPNGMCTACGRAFANEAGVADLRSSESVLGVTIARAGGPSRPRRSGPIAEKL